MTAELVRQDQITNDLANASTPGYKADRATQRSFGDILLQNSASGQTVGPLGLGTGIDSVTTDTAPAPLRETGEPLDFAIQGDGYFAVRTPQGIRYTRGGQFALSPQGTLTDARGDQVLAAGGGPVRAGTGGRVDPRRIGVFALTGVRKVGDALLTGTPAGRARGIVRQGSLEGSGADPTRSMVDMIASYREFEAGQKVIRTIDETLQKAANQVGAVGA